VTKFEQLIARQPKAKKSGGYEYMIVCPFHADKNPSLQVNVAKGLFRCFGCGEKGNAAKLVKQIKKSLSWKEAADYFEPFDTPDHTVFEMRLPDEYHVLFGTTRVGAEGKKAFRYLTTRGVTPRHIRQFALGYCVTGRYARRVIVPVYTNNQLRSFVARDYTGKAEKKVLYPPGAYTSMSLFGYDYAVATNAQTVVVCEGWADALAVMNVIEISSTMASWASVALGTNRISSDQVMLLKRFKSFVTLLDNDTEGRRGEKQVASTLSLLGRVSVAHLRYAKDPAAAARFELIDVLCGGGW
jgi:DNA primase